MQETDIGALIIIATDIFTNKDKTIKLNARIQLCLGEVVTLKKYVCYTTVSHKKGHLQL